MARNPIIFQNGTLIQKATVEIDGNIYEVEPAQYDGTTPLSANNLNLLQTNLYDYVDEKANQEVKNETITVTSGQNQATINFKRVGKVVQITATMTAPQSSTNTNVISFIQDSMPSWAKVKDSNETRTLINQTKIGSLSNMSTYIQVDQISNLQFLKSSTNGYAFRFNVFKSSTNGASEVTITLTGCYITDLD